MLLLNHQLLGAIKQPLLFLDEWPDTTKPCRNIFNTVKLDLFLHCV